MWTICGHREVFEELRPQEQAGSHQLATPDGGPGAAGYIEVQNRGDKSSIPGIMGGEDFLYVFKPGRQRPGRAAACPG